MAKLRIASYQQRAASYYNSKVKVKRFQLDDLVLRKALQNTQEVGARALGPNWEGSYKIVKDLQLGTYRLVRMDNTSSQELGMQSTYGSTTNRLLYCNSCPMYWL